MTVKMLTANAATMQAYIAERISGLISGKIRWSMKIGSLVRQGDWDQEILRGEKLLNSFCWVLLGLSALYFAFVCTTLLFT